MTWIDTSVHSFFNHCFYILLIFVYVPISKFGLSLFIVIIKLTMCALTFLFFHCALNTMDEGFKLQELCNIFVLKSTLITGYKSLNGVNLHNMTIH